MMGVPPLVCVPLRADDNRVTRGGTPGNHTPKHYMVIILCIVWLPYSVWVVDALVLPRVTGSAAQYMTHPGLLLRWWRR